MIKNASLFSVYKALLGLVIVLGWGCGQRGSPTGGLKDTESPEVVKSYPDSLGINFNGKEIFWKFNEYVKISGLAQELLISPPIRTKPTIKMVGKKLTLKFDTTFNENTTYSVYLGKGVKDLNEGNPLENNLLVFSTGDGIDSLSFHGEIYDGESMQAMKDGMVHLYKNISDSTPLTEIPSYFAKIKEGHFHFTNLAAGAYKLIALVDNNANYLFDLPNEKIAFIDTPVVVSNQQDTNELILRSFTTPDNRQFISSKKCDFNGQIKIVFKQSVKEFDAQIIGKQFKKDWNIIHWSDSRDTVTIWSTEILNLDSIQLAIAYDSMKDTLFFPLFNREKFSEQPIRLKHNFKGMGNYFKKPFLLTFSQPISSYDSSKFILQSPTDTSFVGISKKGENIVLTKQLAESSNYTLQLLPNAIKSIFDVSNKDTINLKFSTTATDVLGNLSIDYNFKKASPNGILQLFLESTFIKEIKVKQEKGKLWLEGIKPGNYRLKYISDADNNGKWSAGDYWKKQQSEMVYWYSEPINLRANWELDVNWELIP